MRTITHFFFLLLFLILTTSEILALPRFSVRSGGQCIDCHVNPTGGQMRNLSGWKYGKNNLVMFQASDDEFESSPMLNENVSFGFDLRTQFLAKFDSVNKRSDFQNMASSVYFGAGLSETINLYARYDFTQGYYEGFVSAHIFPDNGYVKVGTFAPNYGIRIDDHTAFTRGGMFDPNIGGFNGWPFTPNYTETGVELGFYISDFAFITASSGSPAGQRFVKDPSYTTSVQFTPQVSDEFSLMAGGSFASWKKGFAPNIADVTSFSGFGGVSFAGFTLLGEFTQAENLFFKDSTSSALMVEASYKITKGLDGVIRYDMLTPVSGNTSKNISGLVLGVEFFPYSFVELKPQYRINTEDPKVDNNMFVLQFHIWY